MSKQVDERVVSMQFDNKNFEKNVSTTMSTLDKFKQKLNFDGASKGLESINAASKKVDMSGLTNGVEAVRMKFSALEVMGVTALANVTNSALNAGKRIVSALAIDPIKTGFQEYETQMNAVQTILANTQSKGSTLKDVNNALDELNEYADLTIYNFTEMTRNIGTFTAAGVDLKTSVSAIQGIANLAAVSGSTSQQASTAMYQLSQALASGTVKLQDWNSVVNAGMGGEVFQSALKKTSEALGTGAEAAIKAEGSFRESLTKGWLTSEVLTETLKKFTTSGANEYVAEYTGLSKEAVEASLKEAKAKYGEADAIKYASKALAEKSGKNQKEIQDALNMAKTATDAATKVKTFSQLWDVMKEAAQSGWSQSWRIIVGDFEEAKEFLTELSTTFTSIIDSSSDARNKVLQGWKDLGGRTALIDALRNSFEGIQSIIKPISEAFREIFPPITSKQLFSFTEGLKNLTAKLKISSEQSAKLKSTFKGLFAILDIVFTIIKKLASGVIKLIKIFASFGDAILGATGSLGDLLSRLRDSVKESDIFGRAINAVVGFLQKAIDKLKEFAGFAKDKISSSGFEMFLGLLKNIWVFLQKIGGKIVEVGSGIGKALSTAFRSGDIKAGIDIFNAGVFTTILFGLKKFIGEFSNQVKTVGGVLNSVKGTSEGIKKILDGVGGCLESWQKNLKANVLLKIAGAIMILAVACLILATIDPDRLTNSLGAIAVLFTELAATMAAFKKISGKSKGSIKGVSAMIGLSVAVLILASALKSLAGLSWKEICKGLIGVAGLTGVLIVFAKIMSKTKGKIMKGATSLIVFAVAIKILASACKDLSSLSVDELARGLVGVGVLMAEVAAFLKVTKNNGNTIKTATGIVILSAAIKILASACKDFAQMSWEEIGKGLASVAALLLEIAIFTKLTGNAKKVISVGIAMIAIGAAMKIFASAMNDLSGMSWEDIAKGLAGLAGSLLSVAITTKLMPKNMVSIGIGLVVVSAAILILANALHNFGSMRWDEIARGLVALGGSITILAIGLNAMKGTLVASAALLIAAASLSILSIVLESIGSMSWEDIAKGLVAIAGSFVIVGVAARVLKPLVPTILALSGAIALLGVACAAVGAGVTLFAAGLGALAGITAAGATAIVGALTIIITGIASLIPTVIEEIGRGIVLFCEAIAEGSIVIGEAIKAIVLTIIDVLVACIPTLLDGLLKLIVGLLESIVKYTPHVVDLLFQFLIGVIEGLARNLPALIQAVANVFKALFSGVLDVLGKIDPDTFIKGLLSVGLIAGIMYALAGLAGLIPAAMVGVLGLGAVMAELAIVLAAIGGIAQIPGLNWIINEGSKLMSDIGNAIGGFIGGIVGGIMTGISASLPQIGNDLSDFMSNAETFINGAKNITPASLEGVRSLVGVIIALTAANVIDSLTSWLTGGSSLTGFAEQLVPFGKAIADFSSKVSGNIDSDAVTAAANAGKIMAEMASTIPNSGGVVGFFAGENNMDTFGEQLVSFGNSITKFSSTVSGNIDADAVTAAANAGKTMVGFQNTLPNTGGVVQWFNGQQNMKTFGEQLVSFGESIAGFSSAVSGNINEDAILSAANAGKIMSEFQSTLPNTGGVVQWFTGQQNMDTFGEQLVSFGESITAFSSKVSGNIDTDAVTAAANAGKAMAELQNTLPNTGGVVQWFTGEQNMATFGTQLAAFGEAFSMFASKVSSGSIDSNAITAAVNAGKAMVELQNTLPNTGGVVQWFTGQQNMGTFGLQIALFGGAIADFSSAVSGNIDSDAVITAAKSGEALAEMASALPNTGGVFQFFTGEGDMTSFAENLAPFGEGIAKFADAVSGIDESSLTPMTVAAEAGKTLAEMLSSLPTSGGIVGAISGAIFGEETDMTTFGDQLESFGESMVRYSESVVDLDAEAVTNSVPAAKSLSDLANSLPSSGGIMDSIFGENDIDKFGERLESFGGSLSNYSKNVVGIDVKSIADSTIAGKSLSDLAKSLPTTGGIWSIFSGDNNMKTFGESLEAFGDSLVAYGNSVVMLKTNSIIESTKAANAIVDFAKNIPQQAGWFQTNHFTEFGTNLVSFGKSMVEYGTTIKDLQIYRMNAATEGFMKIANVASGISSIDFSGMKSLGDSLASIGSNAVNDFIKAFTSAYDRAKTAGSEFISNLISGFKSKNQKLSMQKALMVIGNQCVTTVKNYYTNFYDAGKDLVQGFANGINDNTYLATAKSQAMASAAADAAKKELDEHSPSKVGYKIGDFFGVAFVNAISDYQKKSYNAGSEIANSAKNGLSNAIKLVNSVLNEDMDVQPTIRPVIDLDNVSYGVNAMNRMFALQPSIGVLSNVGAINSMMNHRIQNGNNDDIVSAIDKLRKDMSNYGGDVYNVNGITYDDGSNVSGAVQTLIRAAKIERRR